MEDIINKIPGMMDEKGVTEQDLCDATSVSRTMFWRYKKRRSEMPLSKLREILKYLGYELIMTVKKKEK